MKFVEIVPAYPPARELLTYKEDYFFWPAKMMIDKGFDVEFLTCQRGRQYERYKGLVVKRFKTPFGVLSYINNSRDIALVHSHLRPYPASMLSAFSNKPKILSPHTYLLGSNPVVEKLSIFAMRRFDKVIAFTPYERDVYNRAGLAKKVVLLPHPVDYKFFSSPQQNKAAARKKWGLKDEFVVVTVANIRKVKRIDTILKAFRLFSKNKKARLVIVGEDMLMQENSVSLSELSRQLGVDGVIQTGVLSPEDVRAVLNMSDVFVNSSEVEAQGLAVYEAAAVGLPLCLSNIGSLTSVFGNRASYHKYDNPVELARNLDFYSSSKEKSKAAGIKLRQFIKAWDFDIIWKKMEKLYLEVMDTHPA